MGCLKGDRPVSCVRACVCVRLCARILVCSEGCIVRRAGCDIYGVGDYVYGRRSVYGSGTSMSCGDLDLCRRKFIYHYFCLMHVSV